MDEEKYRKTPQAYKVVYTVIDIPEPKVFRGQPLETTWACPIHKIGDKITLNYAELVIDETDNICVSTLLNLFGRKSFAVDSSPSGWGWEEEPEVHMEILTRCPDPWRSVVFRIDKEPVDLRKKYPLLRSPSERPNWYKYSTTESPQMGCPEKELATLLRMPLDPSENSNDEES